MSDVIWSDDADLHLKAPEALDCFPKSAKRLVNGTDGATGATGKTFTSAAVGSAFLTSGVAAHHFLEILSGEYQGFYKVVTAAASTLTLDRAIAASLSSLAFQVRTFDDWHGEAHAHYQDMIKRAEGLWGDNWVDSDLHAASARKLRDICVARVLATVFRAAAAGVKDSPWLDAAKFWEGSERRLYSEMGPLLLDDDDDDDPDGETTMHTGSMQVGIS